MITIERWVNINTKECELKGLHSDEKPHRIHGRKIHANSLFLELDTGDVYYYTGSSWAKVGGSE